MLKIFHSISFLFVLASASSADTVVFAAASLKGPLDEIVDAINANAPNKVVVSYASSSTLARQIEFGAPADLFLAAHPVWVDHLEDRISAVALPKVFLGNELVIAGMVGTPAFPLTDAGFQQALGDTRLAVPMPRTVPLGIYAKQALTNLNLWNGVKDKLAQTDNALTTRRLLELGEVQIAVLYSSDVTQNPDLSVLARIPGKSHDEIEYAAMALTEAGHSISLSLFEEFARQTFLGAGFSIP